ncbi:DoxX family membrane protein [Microtetraspora sp. NBRC 16547]|uniref:DoxX family membrane protein n=1 Tax=Microtetraspora sp. NBRC 16547 TaxID=3030993 RepID=UPI0024A190B8|nr:DoxX family membrane protein [Microtetraspora sp. NBRC 16547]GLX00787.1 hypothetical protein Misp02_48730 [Microtetraspora sp. NBRC 16547]
MKRTLHDAASLAARMGVGGIFFANGWQKLEAGLNATGAQFGELGAPMPDLWAAATMLIELVGGTLLIAGLAVPFVGLLLFAEAVAVFVITTGQNGMPLTGGDIKLIVALGAASVLLSVGGAGRVSVDHMVVIKRRAAEAADEFAADKEADAVIAALREPTDVSRAIAPGTPGASGPAPTGGSADEPAVSTPKGPITFPTSPDGPSDALSGGNASDAPDAAPGKAGGRTGGTTGKAASKASRGTEHSGSGDGTGSGKAADTMPNTVPKKVPDTASDKAPRSRMRRGKRGPDESAESRSETPAGPEPGDTLVAGRHPMPS